MHERSGTILSSDDERFRREFETSPTVMALFRHEDGDFVLEEVNPAAHTLAHDTVVTFLGRKVSEILHDRPDQMELMQHVHASHEPRTNPRLVHFVTREGEVTLQLHVACLADDRLIVYAREVRRIPELEGRLAAAEKRSELLFEQTTNGFIRLDNLGLIAEANRRAAEFFGRTVHELIGLRFLDIAERLPDIDPDATAAARPGMTEWMLSREDGLIRIVELTERPLDDEGKFLCLHDLTPHFERQARLERRERQTHRMIDFSPDATIVAAYGKVIYANRTFLHLVGAGSREEVVGRPLLSFVHPDDFPYVGRRIEELQQKGSVGLSPAPERLLRLDGSFVEVEVAGMTFEYDEQPAMLFVMRDVGDRERHQEAMRRSEARYRGLFNATSDLVYRISTKGKVLEVNAAVVRVTTWTVEEMSGHSFRHFVHPGDLHAAIAAFQQVMTQGSANVVLRVRRRDGQWAYLDTVNNAEMENGKAVALLGTARDITDRVLAEERLRERERLLSTVLDSLPIGVVVADAAGNIVRSNPPANEIWGFERTGTAIARPHLYRGWWVDSGRRVADDEWASARALRDGTTSLNELIEIERSDGARRIIHNSAAPLRDEEGRNNGVVVLNEDVTEARRKELEQRASDARLREIVASTSDGICTVDAEGRATLVSPAAAAMAGVSPEALLGKNLHAALHADAGGHDFFAEVIRTGQPHPVYDDVFVRHDGTTFDVTVSCAPIRVDRSAHGAVITFRDVTRRKLLERDLERAQRFAAIGQLAATISHEFNNVLMSISPFAEIIERRAVPLGDERTRAAAERIQQALRRGKQITREILKFAQAPEPDMVPARLGELLESSLPELQAIAGSDIAIDVPSIDSELAACVDVIQLHQALSNLIANARDAMKGHGAITIEAGLASPGEIRDGGADGWVRVCVRDEGPGIDPQILDRIFQPLFTTKQAGGTGLGLAVVQQVVTRHGGRLTVDSTVGVGTTFRLYFRRCDAPQKKSAALLPSPASSTTTIVLVEDDVAVAAGLQSVLELEGITTHVVGLGAEAEPAVERWSPDAVIIDRGLPDIDGLDVARRLLARWPKLPLIFSTGHGSRAEMSEIAPDARVALLHKPYSLADLLAVLARLVG